jgi:DNA repair exonuclease SbcCD ATPase subunit
MPAWMAYVGLFALIVSVLSIVLNVILALRKESREDGQTISQRMKKVEGKTGELDAQRQGEERAREKLAEMMRNDYERLGERVEARATQHERETERRLGKLDQDVKEVQGLRERLVRIETELQSLPRIESSVREMNSLLLKFLNDK